MRILLISRHKLLPAQIKALKEKIGEFELLQTDKIFKNKDELIKCVEEYKPNYIIPILPLPLIIDLINYIKEKNKDWVVLKPDMELVERFYDKPVKGDDIVCLKMVEDGKVRYRIYKFKCWKILKDIKIIEEPL